MTDAQRTQLYDAVVAAPHDDAPRLAMADYLDRQGDPWGTFIRTQLALTRALRTGTQDEVARYREEAEQLRRAHGKGWTNGVDKLASLCRFSRGFVEKVNLDAADYIKRADGLFRRAPIRHLVLSDAGDVLATILRDQRIGQLVSLYIGNSSRDKAIGDTGLTAIATCPHLSGLKILEVPFQEISQTGLESLCASRTLSSLIYVNVAGNRFDDPIAGYGTDWMTGMIVADSVYLPPAGKALEARFGRLPWLHSPLLLRNFPPAMEEF